MLVPARISWAQNKSELHLSFLVQAATDVVIAACDNVGDSDKDKKKKFTFSCNGVSEDGRYLHYENQLNLFAEVQSVVVAPKVLTKLVRLVFKKRRWSTWERLTAETTAAAKHSVQYDWELDRVIDDGSESSEDEERQAEREVEEREEDEELSEDETKLNAAALRRAKEDHPELFDEEYQRHVEEEKARRAKEGTENTAHSHSHAHDQPKKRPPFRHHGEPLYHGRTVFKMLLVAIIMSLMIGYYLRELIDPLRE